MFSRNRNRNPPMSYPGQPPNIVTHFQTQNVSQPHTLLRPNQQTSFPELVGRSAQEAVAYLSARGITFFSMTFDSLCFFYKA